MQPKGIILFFYGYILFFRRQFITKIKEYFNEKQIKIYWSDKYMKQLFIYSN